MATRSKAPAKRKYPYGFTLYRDRSVGRTWRWRLVSRNGRVVADSGEGYRRRYDATRMIGRLKLLVRAPITVLP